MQIQSYTATEAARNLGLLLDESQKNPVEIKKAGQTLCLYCFIRLF